ncbi:MAG: hypothetical protein LBK97_02020 [Prevotellaceae bacterium]|jgi:hypothetical protein|nr:hypothetical protein [Prevotellaceae bacterium]
MANHIDIRHNSYNIGIDVPLEIEEVVSQRHSFINKFKWKWSALLISYFLLIIFFAFRNSERNTRRHIFASS